MKHLKIRQPKKAVTISPGFIFHHDEILRFTATDAVGRFVQRRAAAHRRAGRALYGTGTKEKASTNAFIVKDSGGLLLSCLLTYCFNTIFFNSVSCPAFTTMPVSKVSR